MIAQHEHTVEDLLSAWSPTKRLWEFKDDIKLLFLERDDTLTFKELIERINEKQAALTRKGVILTETSCEDFWLGDRHTLEGRYKSGDQLKVCLCRVVQKKRTDKADVLHAEWSISIPHEDLCKLKGESSEEIALDSQTVRSTVKLREDSEVEWSSEASEAVITLALGRVQSSCDVFGSFHKPVKRRRSFVSGTEDSCYHHSKENKRL
jgi:hypothetical protein